MKRRRPVHPITARRKELNLSGYALAKKIGITATHLRDIELGNVAAPRVDIAVRIAEALKADVTELFRPGAAA